MSFSKRKDQSGFALMYAIIGLVFVTILLFFLSDYVLNLSKQAGRKVSLTQGRMVLHSLADYTVYGIKQRWCFDDFWVPLGGDSCLVTHPRSVERLLINDDSLRIYNQMVADGQIPGAPIVALQEISAIVDLEGMLPAHPLYPIVQTARVLAPISKADIRISRDRRPQMPVGGREMFLNLTIRILDGSDNLVMWQNLPMEIKTTLSVFPRELGSFALIAARDLRLDLGYADSVDLGDLIIHQFGSRSQAAGWPGLIFESPVFVNRNLVLPSSPMDANMDDPRYAAVTFADKVFLGSGQIMRNGVLFRPRAAGDNADQLWTQVREFGGMNRGIEIDGTFDEGLNMLAGYGTISAASEARLDRCRRLAAVKSRLEYTRSSQVASRFVDGNFRSGFRMRLGFSQENWVIPQERDGSRVGQFHLDARNEVANQNFNIGGGGQGLRIGDEISRNYSPNDHPSLPGWRSQRDAACAAARNANPADPALSAECTRLTDLVSTHEEISARETRVVVQVRETVTGQGPQPNYIDLIIRADDPNAFVDSSGNPIGFTLGARVYDVGCDGDRCREERASWWDRPYVREENVFLQKGYLNFTVTGGTLTPPSGTSRSPGGAPLYADIPAETENWRELENSCTYGTGSAFGGSDWANTSFVDSTFFSWNFAPPLPERATSRDYYQPGGGTVVFNGANSNPTSRVEFKVQSLVDRCVIQSTATFVTGFFNCRHLEIQARTAPLRIAGTFILSRMTIDPSAYQYGIRWSSIYHPMATPELITAGVLRPVNPSPSVNCYSTSVTPYPIWHPHPSIQETANGFNCSTLSLRLRADPMTWTTVTPDCGLIPGSSRLACKNRIVKSVVYEINRESGL